MSIQPLPQQFRINHDGASDAMVVDQSTCLTYGELRDLFYNTADSLNIHHMSFQDYQGPTDPDKIADYLTSTSQLG
ncbi:MAG: hypothetical protein AB8B83_06170 [Bdellovibrionales bacterium]